MGLGVARALNMLDGARPYIESLSVNDKRIGDEVLSVQIHGDAAFGGQGVVAETLNLSELVSPLNITRRRLPLVQMFSDDTLSSTCQGTLPHFTVGGSVRLVLNNQVRELINEFLIFCYQRTDWSA